MTRFIDPADPDRTRTYARPSIQRAARGRPRVAMGRAPRADLEGTACRRSSSHGSGSSGLRTSRTAMSSVPTRLESELGIRRAPSPRQAG